MAERKFKTRSEQDVNFEKTPRVEGVITRLDKLPEKFESRRFVVLDCPDGLWRVYESKSLEDVFKLVAVGDHLLVEFVETVKLDGNKTFNRYRSELWTEK